jgi:hypothetical protein
MDTQSKPGVLAMRSYARLKFICSLFLLVAADKAIAAEWIAYFENRAGVSFSNDAGSIVSLEDGNVRAWQKQEFKEPNPTLGKGFLWLLEANCRERKYIYRTITPITATVGNLKQMPLMMELYGEWNYFQPSELDEATFSAWCKRK